jgi:TetR/AcrR family transcriptional regulator, transcriptional repressor for nem operon
LFPGQVPTPKRLADSAAELLPTLNSYVSRPGRARSAYTRQVGAYLELLTGLIASDRPRSKKRMKAIAALSTLVGTVSLARAVNDEKLSREILKSAAEELKAQLG